MRQTQHDVSVRWKPFLLRPGIPVEGVEKGGTPETRVPGRMKTAGASVGIAFTGLCSRYPNTLAAHALLEWAADVAPEKQNELSEVLFRQYFTDGVYPSPDALADAAVEVGLDREQAKAEASSQANQQRAGQAARRHAEAGVTGVPFFYINGKPAFSGAQPPDQFAAAFASA